MPLGAPKVSWNDGSLRYFVLPECRIANGACNSRARYFSYDNRTGWDCRTCSCNANTEKVSVIVTFKLWYSIREETGGTKCRKLRGKHVSLSAVYAASLSSYFSGASSGASHMFDAHVLPALEVQLQKHPWIQRSAVGEIANVGSYEKSLKIPSFVLFSLFVSINHNASALFTKASTLTEIMLALQLFRTHFGTHRCKEKNQNLKGHSVHRLFVLG